MREIPLHTHKEQRALCFPLHCATLASNTKGRCVGKEEVVFSILGWIALETWTQGLLGNPAWMDSLAESGNPGRHRLDPQTPSLSFIQGSELQALFQTVSLATPRLALNEAAEMVPTTDIISSKIRSLQ